VKAEAPHFSPANSSNITLAADTTPQLNLQLSITAAVTQTVTVTGAPPPLQTSSAEVSQGVTSRAAGGSGLGLGKTTGTDRVHNQSIAAGFDYALNANLFTDLRFGFLDCHVAENKYDTGATPALAADIANLSIPGVPNTYGWPTYNFSDSSIGNSALGQWIGNQGCNCPLLESEQVFQFVNNWTKIVGNHSIRFVADIRYALNLRNASDNK